MISDRQSTSANTTPVAGGHASGQAALFVLSTCIEMTGLGVLIVGLAPVVGGQGPVYWGHQITGVVLAVMAVVASVILYERDPRLRYWTASLPEALKHLAARLGGARRPTGSDGDGHGWWHWITPWLGPIAVVVAVVRLLAITAPAEGRGWACFAFLVACLAAGSQRRRWLLLRSSPVWASVSLPITTWFQSLLTGAAVMIVVGSFAPALSVPVASTTRFLVAMIALQVIFIPLEVLLLPPRRSARRFLESLFAGRDALWFWIGTILIGCVGATGMLWTLPVGLHWLGALAALVGTLLLRALWLAPAYR